MEDAASTDAEPDQSLQLATSAALVLLSGDGNVDVANRLLSSALNHAEQAGDIGRQEHEEALHALLRACYFSERPELWDGFYQHLARLPDPPAALAISSRTPAGFESGHGSGESCCIRP